MKELNIAKKIVERRKEKGLTQEDLAKFIGVSKASVSKWETGQSYPDILFLPQLASYFNISIDELIGYSPQMQKSDIQKLYQKLSHDFTKKTFEQVWEECQAVTKKYYACFPLLFEMSVLYFNHYPLAEEARQGDVFDEILRLCTRVKDESDDVFLSSQANSMMAMCHLMLGQPEETLELLAGALERTTDDGGVLLSQAYQMLGNLEKAEEVLQVCAYQYLIAFGGCMPSLLALHLDEPEVFKEILSRSLTVTECFHTDSLNPNTTLQLYLAAAQGYLGQDVPEKAIDMLERYVTLCGKSFPIVLHGDSFFDHIDDWLKNFTMGNHVPRDEKLIKMSMLAAIQNPVFSSKLETQPRYGQLLRNLQETLGVE